MISLEQSTNFGPERTRLAMDRLGIAFFESDLLTGQAVNSDNAFTILGLPRPAGGSVRRATVWDCIHPDDVANARLCFEAALRGEDGQDSYHERVRIIRRTDGRIRWIEFLGHVAGPPGARTHIAGMLRDVTEIVEAEDRQHLLMREVNHRANNALAVVQALVRLTRGETVQDYQARLEARLLALGRSQSLLRDFEPTPRGIVTLIDNELGAYRDFLDLAMDQPPDLGANALQPVAMILHELATNAAKHGALAGDGGRVRIDCDRQDQTVLLRWSERGGAPVREAPREAGTGMTVIRAQIRRLAGHLAWDWRPEGLALTARIPLSVWCA